MSKNHDENTRVLIAYTKRQQGFTIGDTRGLAYKHAKRLVDVGVAQWVKVDETKVNGFASADAPYCCTQRIKTVRKKGELISEGSYVVGGPLKLTRAATKAVVKPPEDKQVRSAPSTK